MDVSTRYHTASGSGGKRQQPNATCERRVYFAFATKRDSRFSSLSTTIDALWELSETPRDDDDQSFRF
jgi:hypothetical protein